MGLEALKKMRGFLGEDYPDTPMWTVSLVNASLNYCQGTAAECLLLLALEKM